LANNPEKGEGSEIIGGIIFTSQNAVHAFSRSKVDYLSSTKNSDFVEIVEKKLSQIPSFVVGESTEKLVTIQLLLMSPFSFDGF
jgi:uroporphyrinogen-III synthase